MPRRPMDSSFLWLPPVLAVLAAGAPGTDQWQAVCDRCPVFTSRKLGQPTLAQNREIASVLHDASSSNCGFEFFPPCWPNWLPTGLLGSA